MGWRENRFITSETGQMEKRSPADGNGVTSCNNVKSGKFWMCDCNSSRTVVTLVNFRLYSYKT